MPELIPLVSGLAFRESPRWHAGRLWVADWGAAVWYVDVANKHCVRVREGGEVLQTIEIDRCCFACMLGGPDGMTLFIVATEWRGAEAHMTEESRTGQLLTVRAPAPHAGWP
jgi:sugar lactone lactonase YvrE